MVVVRLVVTLGILFALAFFGVRNMESVPVDYYVGVVRVPLFLLMAVLILLGTILAASIGIVDQLRLKSTIRSLSKRIRELEREEAGGRRRVPGNPSGKNAGDDGSDGEAD